MSIITDLAWIPSKIVSREWCKSYDYIVNVCVFSAFHKIPAPLFLQQLQELLDVRT